VKIIKVHSCHGRLNELAGTISHRQITVMIVGMGTSIGAAVVIGMDPSGK